MPCTIRLISVGDGGGRQGTAGDCRVKFFATFNNFVCLTKAGTCVKDNKRRVLFYEPGFIHKYFSEGVFVRI